MRHTNTFDERFADLVLHARGLEAVRSILAARGASDEELEEHAQELRRVRARLAQRLAA